MNSVKSFPFALNQGRHSVLLFLLVVLALRTGSAHAQFSTTAAQTQFLCNASGVQFSVQAFADGTGGAYSVWIDKHAGNIGGPGTALYAQHLDQAGTALLPANGVALHTVEPDRLVSVDYVPVGQPNGSVQVFWSAVGTVPTGQDICTGRM